MLEHQMLVLQGVAENRQLFEKELKKSLLWLQPEEIVKLRNWVFSNFQKSHAEVIEQIFYQNRAIA